MKEHEAVFSKRQNSIFSIVAGSIWFFYFYFVLVWIFLQVFKFAVTFGGRGGEGIGVWILIYIKRKQITVYFIDACTALSCTFSIKITI